MKECAVTGARNGSTFQDFPGIEMALLYGEPVASFLPLGVRRSIFNLSDSHSDRVPFPNSSGFCKFCN